MPLHESCLGFDKYIITDLGHCIIVRSYCKSELTADQHKFGHFNVSNPDIELQVIYSKKILNKGIILLNVYRPPQGNQQSFDDHILDVTQQINSDRYADIYVTGDMNLDHLTKSRSTLTSQFIQTMKASGFTQLIDQHTPELLIAAHL